MKNKKLNPEDQEMLKAFEAGEFASDLKDKRRTQLAKLAEETVRKDKRLNIRISRRDLEALQRKAIKEGLPYQSHVSSVLHKYTARAYISFEQTSCSTQLYVSGGFKDIAANKAGQRTNR